MDIATFTDKTARTVDGCLLWTGRRTRDGYGIVSEGRTTLYVHRWAYEQFVGPIPDGLQVDHLCNRTGCAEPTHLEPVTSAENMRRAVERRTQCRNGHPYTADNVYIYPSTGRRSCRTCRKIGTKRFFEKNPGYHAEWERRRRAG